MKQEVDNASRGESSQAARDAQFSNFHQDEITAKDRNSQLESEKDDMRISDISALLKEDIILPESDEATSATCNALHIVKQISKRKANF